jgi:hypothetical protein
MPFVQLQHFFDASGTSTPFHMRSHLIGATDGFTDDTIDMLVEHALPVTSPLSAVIILPMGGAIGQVPPDATAFRHRDASHGLELAVAWPSVDEDPRPHRTWSDRIWEAMRPWSAGAEVNHLIDEGPDRVRDAYGDNYPRLAALKQAWDPDNVFRLNQNIPPAPDRMTAQDGSDQRQRRRDERSRRAVAAVTALAGLADLFSLMVHLWPAPVVARVSTCLPRLRTPIADWLGRELAVTAFLVKQGAPVVA